ncbi:hypothetical protein AOLI_G00325800 [Acnodon oligacanthus]
MLTCNMRTSSSEHHGQVPKISARNRRREGGHRGVTWGKTGPAKGKRNTFTVPLQVFRALMCAYVHAGDDRYTTGRQYLQSCRLIVLRVSR